MEIPIFVKIGATRPFYDTSLAIKAGADAIVIDGMQGGTAATQDIFIEHVGIPTLACIRSSVEALQEQNLHRQVQLIVSGGIRNGADVAKALALGADVPVFVHKKSCYASGIGDILGKKSFNASEYLLICPQILFPPRTFINLTILNFRISKIKEINSFLSVLIKENKEFKDFYGLLGTNYQIKRLKNLN